MKKVIAVILLMVTMTLFVSCSVHNGIILDGDIKSTSTSIEGKYHKFNGKYYKRIKFKQSDLINYTSNSTTNNGELQLLLLDKDDNIIADLNDVTPIEILNDGYYYFTVLGKNHSGDFKVEWSKE